MAGRHYYFINGILNCPSSTTAITDIGCDWINRNTPYTSDKFEYFCEALFRRLKQDERVERVFERIRGRKNVVLVGHSNGCDIICRLLKNYEVQIDEIHLIAGACDCDYDKNGLNEAVRKGRVKRIYIYVSPNDRMLMIAKGVVPPKAKFWERMAAYGSRAAHSIKLGYGWMGLDGPCNMTPQAESVTFKIPGEADHSEWYGPKHLETTMRNLVHAVVLTNAR